MPSVYEFHIININKGIKRKENFKIKISLLNNMRIGGSNDVMYGSIMHPGACFYSFFFI